MACDVLRFREESATKSSAHSSFGASTVMSNIRIQIIGAATRDDTGGASFERFATSCYSSAGLCALGTR